MHDKASTSKVQYVSSLKLNKVQKTCYVKINWPTLFSKPRKWCKTQFCFLFLLILFYFIFIFFQIKKKGRKRKQIVFCTIFLVLKTRLVNLFLHNMSFVHCLALMSLLIAPYLLKPCSACYVGKMFMVLITLSWSWSHMSLIVGLEPFEKGINNHLTTVH